MQSLQARLDSLSGATTTELLDWMQREIQSMGFDYMMLAMLPSSTAPLDSAFIFSNYPTAWRSRYDEQKLAAIDPTVLHSLKRGVPLVWNAGTFSGARERQLYEEARSHGLAAGVTLPLHAARGGAGMLTCVTSDDSSASARLIEIQLGALTLLRDIALDLLAQLEEPQAPFTMEDAPQLSERERQCLIWHAAGKTSWEIGRILNVTEACVNFHFSNIRVKFKVSRRHEAVLKAVNLGMITLA